MKKTLSLSLVLGFLSVSSVSASADNGHRAYLALVKQLRKSPHIGDCQVNSIQSPRPGETVINLRLRTGELAAFLLNDPATSPESKVVYDRQAGTFDAMDSNVVGWQHQVFRMASNGCLASFSAFQTLGGTSQLLKPVQVICQ